jgi:hypothetical protein
MKNPLKPNRSGQDHDNPAVPIVVERPVERSTDRAAMHDNPLVPNAIERPFERAVADDRGAAADRRGSVDRADTHDADTHDAPGDRTGVVKHPSDRAFGASTSPTSTDGTRQMDLFPGEELVGYRTQWESIQTGFVDQPRAAVEQADALVSQLVTRLTEVFTRERSTLEEQWTKGDNVSTEDLRIALTRYRSFFNRLLSM